VDDVEEVGGDGVEDPRDDDAVHARPRRIVGMNDVAEDMVLQGKAAEDEQEVATPLGVVGGLQVEDDGNQILDVLHSSSLAMEASDGHGFRGDRTQVVVVVGSVVAERFSAEPFAEGGGLPLQSVGLLALRIEGGGGGANAFLSIGGGLEEGRLLLELLGPLGVGVPQGGGLVFQSLGGGEGFVTKLCRGGGRRGAGTRTAGGRSSHGGERRRGARSGRRGARDGRPSREARARREAGAGCEAGACGGKSGSRGKGTGPD
jgi:hypothetical protein